MKPNILIVDDDVQLVCRLEMALRHEYRVASTYPPERALEIFHNGDFDLVLTAIQMPNLSGFEILRAVQETNPVVEVIHYDKIILDHAGQEKTAVRFRVAQDGRVTDTSHVEKSLVQLTRSVRRNAAGGDGK